MKGILTFIICLFLLPGFGRAEYWENTALHPVVCREDKPGCQVLQTVMLGSFARFDSEDKLNVRVFSAALPRLTAVTEDDFLHFEKCFDVEAETLEKLYYIALGNCFLSDIIVSPLADSMDEQNARTVLHLFLNPVGEGAQAQMQAIRSNCGEAEMAVLAENAHVPLGFVRYLIGGEGH